METVELVLFLIMGRKTWAWRVQMPIVRCIHGLGFHMDGDGGTGFVPDHGAKNLGLEGPDVYR